MSRSVNEIECIVLTVKLVVHLDGMALDCDATLALQIHVVEYLRLEVFTLHCIGVFQQAVCESTFSVVDMCYYAEIAYILHLRCFIANKVTTI